MVCSFFLCHRHLWSVLSFFATGICVQSQSFMAFSAVGIRVRLSVFALLALVSGYQCISQFLVSCCALAACQLHPWRFELEFCPSRLPCGQPYKFRLEANPIWYSAIKFTNPHSWKCSLHKWVWLMRSINVSSFELYTFDPFSQHSRPAWLELFVDHTHTHSMNNLRWQPHWLPRLMSLPRKSRVWWRTRDSSLGQPTENKIH